MTDTSKKRHSLATLLATASGAFVLIPSLTALAFAVFAAADALL